MVIISPVKSIWHRNPVPNDPYLYKACLAQGILCQTALSAIRAVWHRGPVPNRASSSDLPGLLQFGSKSFPRGFRRAPRELPEVPGDSKKAFKRLQEASKRLLDAFRVQDAIRISSWTHFWPPKESLIPQKALTSLQQSLKISRAVDQRSSRAAEQQSRAAEQLSKSAPER